MEGISERIRTGRNNVGLTQTQLGRLVGVSLRQVQKWEAGKDKPSFDRLPAIASALQKDVIWLIGENRPVNEVIGEIGDSNFSKLAGVDIAALRAKIIQLSPEQLRAAGIVRMPERNPKRIDRRDELAVYRIKKKDEGHAVPKWLNLACGNGCDLERSPDFIYFELPGSSKGLHSAVIRGDSMADTLLPGDVVILEEFAGGPIELGPLGDDPKNSYKQLHSRVPDESICVVQINEEPPTLKRMIYDFSRGMMDWMLLITAENALVWRPRPIGGQDTVRFWAKLIGIGERLPAKSPSNVPPEKTKARPAVSKAKRSPSIPVQL